MRTLLIIALVFGIGIAHAADRQLALDGNVAITIDSNYECSMSAPLKINAPNALFYEYNTVQLQRLIGVARAAIGFECDKVQQLNIKGYVNQVEIYRGTLKASKQWVLRVLKTPLQEAANDLSSLPPNYSSLLLIKKKLKPFNEVAGIKTTQSYQDYYDSAEALTAKIIDGDMAKFSAYLSSELQKKTSYPKVASEFKNILNAIQQYTPAQFRAHEYTYNEVIQEYWITHIQKLMEDEDLAVDEVISQSETLVADAALPDNVTRQIDEKLSDWTNNQIATMSAQLDEAYLSEVSAIDNYIEQLAKNKQSTKLPKTGSAIEVSATEAEKRINARVSEYQETAISVIKETGHSYLDASDILELGFTLAAEFEEADYIAQSEQVLAATMQRVELILESGLADYTQELQVLTSNVESMDMLHAHIEMFKELGADFEGAKAYQVAAEKVVQFREEAVCRQIAIDAHPNWFSYHIMSQYNILMGEHAMSFEDFSCALYRNGHILLTVNEGSETGEYYLKIKQADDMQSTLALKRHSKGELARYYVGKKLLSEIPYRAPEDKWIDYITGPVSTEDTQRDFTMDEWFEYISYLVLPPSTGEPDENGVTECDLRAGDPHDPQRQGQGVDLDAGEYNPKAIDRALDACIAALEYAPDSSRQAYQLGRLLDYMGDTENAREYFASAGKAGYAAAVFKTAEALYMTAEDHNTTVDVVEILKEAANSGYQPAQDMIDEIVPPGTTLYKEIPPPTDEEAYWAFIYVHGKYVNAQGFSASLDRITVQNCFQLNESDFSCNYTKYTSCRSNNPLLNFFVKMACVRGEETMGTFRKISAKKWRWIGE